MEKQNNNICISVVNFKVNYGNKELNLKKIKDFSSQAANNGANIVLFPEMCLTSYDYYVDSTIDKEEKFALAETIPGPSTEIIAEVAKKYQIYIVFGMPQKMDNLPGLLFNSAAVVGPDGVIGAYRKIHPWHIENTWCAKGDAPFMFDTKWGPVAVGICYDTYSFPELMRYYASKGSRLYLNLTAIIREDGSNKAFEEGYFTYLKYGVLSNHIFIASSNLVGYDSKNCFGGGSVIIGPKSDSVGMIYSSVYGGDIQCNQEGVFTGSIDLSLARRTIFQKNQYTGEPDYRPDLYKTFK
jgi:predicted amidohydrolase